MKKWEYKIFPIPTRYDEMERSMNTFGELGWEIVSIYKDLWFICKKETSNEYLG
jgi:hypothetical protein